MYKRLTRSREQRIAVKISRSWLHVCGVGLAVSSWRRTFTKLAELSEARLPEKKSSVEFSAFARKSFLFCVEIIDFHVAFEFQRIHFSSSYGDSVKK